MAFIRDKNHSKSQLIGRLNRGRFMKRPNELAELS